MTFHGAPLHNLALEAGVKYLATRGIDAIAPLHLILRTMLDFIPDEHDTTKTPPWHDEVAEAYAHIEDENERADMIKNLGTDFHGGFFETSVLLHYAPDAVGKDLRNVPPCPKFGKDARLAIAAKAARAIGANDLARELYFAALGYGWYLLRPFPGYTSSPHRATEKSGAFFAKYIVDRYAEAAEGVFSKANAAPKPIMSWVATASLGGRAGGIHVPLEAIG